MKRKRKSWQKKRGLQAGLCKETGAKSDSCATTSTPGWRGWETLHRAPGGARALVKLQSGMQLSQICSNGPDLLINS